MEVRGRREMQSKDGEHGRVVTNVNRVELQRGGKSVALEVETNQKPRWDGGIATIEKGESVN